MYGTPYKIHRIFTISTGFSRISEPSTVPPSTHPTTSASATCAAAASDFAATKAYCTAGWGASSDPMGFSADTPLRNNLKKKTGGFSLANWKAHLKPNWNRSFVDVFFFVWKILNQTVERERQKHLNQTEAYFFWGAMALYLFVFPMKNDCWKTTFLLGWLIFKGELLNFQGVYFFRVTFQLTFNYYRFPKKSSSRGSPF